MRYLDKKQRNQIGYNYIIEKLQIISPYGMNSLKNIRPFLKGEEVQLEKEHKRIEAAIEVVQNKKTISKLELLLMKIKNVENTCTACSKGKVLDEVELYELKIQSMDVEKIRETIKTSPIPNIEFYSLSDIIKLLDPDNIDLPTYAIYSSYSTKLKEIRKEKKKLEEDIYKAKSTEDIEELKKRRLSVVIEENSEELEVRKYLSNSLKPLMDKFLKNIATLGSLDLLLAKGKLCNRYNLKQPKINNTNTITAKNLINLKIKDMVEASGLEYTPIDITLTRGTTIITGANMGGKTVALKNITLNVFLFQMGFYPLGENVTMPLFDFIDFISDDMQDVSKGLSTFGAEMMKLKEIMIFLHRGQGFIALDEFARGTNPYEGQKIAKSLGEYLNKFDSIGLMATHYDGVIKNDMTHYQVVGLRDVDFDSLKRKIDLNKKDSIQILQNYMNYSLEKSRAYEAPKDALNITMLLGIHDDFTNYILKNYKGEE